MKKSTNPEELNGIEISVKSSMLTAEDVQGIVINEILADPNSSGGANFDTDGDGTAETDDEFVELFNTSGDPVDISGWTITDAAGGMFTFPGGTIIQPGEHVTVVADWDPGDPPAGFFTGLPAMNNGGDVVVLSDGSNTATASYGSGSGGDDFGSPGDGVSMSRVPDGSMTIDNMATPTPECFLQGTSINTESGQKTVESLNIGDIVSTENGPRKIKWIGYQTIEPNHSINPICIKAGALGNNIPSRDLRVSPDHSMLIDGLLINAGALVNGVNIIKTQPTASFKYYHVELEEHAILFAEGAAAESYLPQKEDRSSYDNASEYEALYPNEAGIMLWPMSYPRISAAHKVPQSIQDRILANHQGEVKKTA